MHTGPKIDTEYAARKETERAALFEQMGAGRVKALLANNELNTALAVPARLWLERQEQKAD